MLSRYSKPMEDKFPKINIFLYDDYRTFLKDWYWAAKKSRGSFSFRTFSKRGGFKSTNILKLIMDGDRNLSEESITQFSLALKLNKQEQEFFRNLVFLNQAKTHEQKDLYYQRLLRSKKLGQLKPMEKEQYEYYSSWHHPVIRELVVSPTYNGHPDSIAQKVRPSITSTQVEKSILLLEKLGFIQKKGRGRWKQASSLVTTGAEVSSVVVFNYHKTLLDLAKEVLDKVPASRRDVSSLTLGISKDRLPQLKKKIQEFRQEILKMVSLDTSPEEVVQLNMQFFPLTEDKK